MRDYLDAIKPLKVALDNTYSKVLKNSDLYARELTEALYHEFDRAYKFKWQQVKNDFVILSKDIIGNKKPRVHTNGNIIYNVASSKLGLNIVINHDYVYNTTTYQVEYKNGKFPRQEAGIPSVVAVQVKKLLEGLM